MKFLVIVTCAVAGACPLPNGYKDRLPAASEKECHSKVNEIIRHFGYKPRDFRVECRKQ